eukprot:scaffold117683_cov46-Cyclotella_meneghiniana.AAC.5
MAHFKGDSSRALFNTLLRSIVIIIRLVGGTAVWFRRSKEPNQHLHRCQYDHGKSHPFMRTVEMRITLFLGVNDGNRYGNYGECVCDAIQR